MKIEIKNDLKFKKILNEMNAAYDENWKTYHMPFSSPGYHTTLTGGEVHGTREAFRYALVLLNSGESQYINRAIEVIEGAISLQDQNPESETYGIWPWYYEEPLSKMNPPDWNWADFCAKALCVIINDFEKELPENTVNLIKHSIKCACDSIIKRDVDESYTNIAIMDCYVTVMAGQIFNDNNLLDYGRNKLKRMYENTIANGGFSEYNSPTYTMVVLGDLSAMQNHFRDEESVNYARLLAKEEWKCIATHWHVRTKQWTGPHSRCYNSILEQELLEKLQKGVPEAHLSENEDIISKLYGSKWECPEEYKEYFINLRTSFDSRVFVKDKSTYITAENVYITPEYTMGSFEVSDFWEQRRNLICYYSDSDNPGYMWMRVLHDGRDFTAAQMSCMQKDGTAAITIHFANDSGDEHLVFNKIQNKTIVAEDIRIRFFFFGYCGETVPVWENGTTNVKDRGFSVKIHVDALGFCEYTPQYEVRVNDDGLCVDVVLFCEDEKKKVVLDNMRVCAAAFVSTDRFSDTWTVDFDENTVKARVNELGIESGGTAVTLPEKKLRSSMWREKE